MYRMRIDKVATPSSKVCKSLLAAAFASTTVLAQAPVDTRIALVIGNAAYQQAARLANPVNDATSMAATLKILGFEVVQVKDGSLAQMKEAVQSVQARLQSKNGIGVLYYAGHGVQLDFRNFLIPVDANLSKATDVPVQTLDVATVIDAFKAAGNRMNILVLDACRDNPFLVSATAKGLAPIDAPSGTLLAYATAPGNVASDGEVASGNGLYTGHLIRELQKPVTRIEDVFKRVRLQVRQDSAGRQIPWESTSLEEDFYFNDGVKHTFRTEDLQRVSSMASNRGEQLAKEAARAQEASAKQAAAKVLEDFLNNERQRLKGLQTALQQSKEADRLKTLPVEQARDEQFRAEKSDWDQVRLTKNPVDLYAFLKKYPAGSMSELAQFELDRLQQVALKVQLGREGVAPLASGARRFYLGDQIEYDITNVMNGRTGRDRDTVTKADDGRVEINDGAEILDQMGSKQKDRYGTYDPPLLLSPAELALGKKWTSSQEVTFSSGQRSLVTTESEVQALEDVTVPAGKFKAFRVASRRNMGDLQVAETRWIAPELMWTVRVDRIEHRGGQLQRNLIVVVRSMKRAARPI
jgi:hypothetical protein